MAKIFSVALVLLAPSVVVAAPGTFSEFVNIIVDVLNNGVMVLVTLALAVYFFGISTNITNLKEDAKAQKRFFFWGIVVLFVMVSVWGILNLIQNTLLGTALDVGASNVGSSELCDSFGNCGLE